MPKSATVQVEAEAEFKALSLQEQELLVGFRDLVAEGLGYHFGAKAVQSEGSEATKDQRATNNANRKNISSHLEEWIKDADIEAYQSAVEEYTTSRKALSEAMKPYNTRKAPLARAWKYCVNVAFPDSLKEIGAPVQPRFKLSEWIKEATKKKK